MVINSKYLFVASMDADKEALFNEVYDREQSLIFSRCPACGR
jgi:hypothetical protein